VVCKPWRNHQVAVRTIRAVHMRVPVSMLAELANDDNVTYITPDRQMIMTRIL